MHDYDDQLTDDDHRRAEQWAADEDAERTYRHMLEDAEAMAERAADNAQADAQAEAQADAEPTVCDHDIF